MHAITPTGATIPEVSHHSVDLNGTQLHYVSAGSTGSPILLVHGFPESWWAFRKLIPLLAREHRVFAVDLRGFGDSGRGDGPYGSAVSAEDLHHLVRHLDVGPVHLLGQDISGGVVCRLAANRPEDLASLIGVETGLAGFGAERLADVTNGGAWYIGALVTPGIAELLFAGREQQFIGDHLYPAYGVSPVDVTIEDVVEFARTYARPGGLRGAVGLYRSLLEEGEELRTLFAAKPLAVPVLAVGSGGGSFTAKTLQQIRDDEVIAVELAGVGHYVAQQAPEQLAEVLLEHMDRLDVTATSL